MMGFISGFQPSQYFKTFFSCRLFHRYRLETPFQRRIFFDIFAVLRNRSRSDQLHFSACKGRFQNAGRIDSAFRSSGAGGQHVNKTESAIRITHLPTGTVVECQDERSQYKNKDRAMKILRSKLYEAQQEKQNAAIAAQRKSQVGTGDRSGKIRTYNFPQNRVTDHRLTGDAKNFNIAAIINGDLDPLIDALTLAHQAQRLQEGAEKGE